MKYTIFYLMVFTMEKLSLFLMARWEISLFFGNKKCHLMMHHTLRPCVCTMCEKMKELNIQWQTLVYRQKLKLEPA
jgi:hypothetical protein